MNKKSNGMFKAVSVIALVFAIILSVSTVLYWVAALVDFESFAITFAEIETSSISTTITLTPENMDYVRRLARSSLLVMSILLIAGQAFLYVVYAKFRKYTELTDEEAVQYSSKIIVWIVFLFLFTGILLGLIALIGYTTITKEQVNNYKLKEIAGGEQTEKSVEKCTTEEKDLDKMMDRLEKLNKIKEMGGITDEEYEKLRQDIVNR